MALARWMKTLLPTGRRESIEARRPQARRFRGMLEQLETRESPVTWLGNTTGLQGWNTGTNWQGGVPPVSGPTTQLTFLNNTQTGYTANNDIPGSQLNFLANQISFDSRYGFFNPITSFITGADTSGFTDFTNGATLRQDGTAGASFGMTGTTLAGQLTITGAGNGALFFDPLTSAASGAVNPAIVVDRTGYGLNVIDFLSGASAVPVGLTINQGNVAIGFTGSSHGSPLTINGGTLRYGERDTTLPYSNANAVVLNSTLNIVGNNGVTLTGAVTGLGGINVTPFVPVNVILRSAGAFAGGLTAGSSLDGLAGATVTLGTTAGSTLVGGSVLNAGSVTADRGGVIQLDNRLLPLALSSNPNRIGDNTPVFVHSGGTLQLIGYTGLTNSLTSEVVGSLNLSGNPTIEFTNTSGFTPAPGSVQFFGNNALSVNGIVVTGGTSALVKGNNLGRTATLNSDFLTGATLPGNNLVFIGGGGAAGSTNINITPQIYANEWTTPANGLGNTLVTQAGLGLRPLEFTEYRSDLGAFDGFTTTTNFRLLGGIALNANPTTTPTRINALVLDAAGAAAFGQVNGTGRLVVESGAILASGAGANVDPNSAQRNRIDIAFLDFANRNGTIITPTALTISSAMLGNAGYTKAGAGTLALTGNNTGLSGAVFLTGGTTQVANLTGSLGGSNTVTLNGGTLQYTGAGETFARGFFIGDGDGTINVGAGVTLVNGGATDGIGTLYKTGTGTLALTGNTNANTGTIQIQQGALSISSAASLGSATINMPGGSTLLLPNGMNFASKINLLGGAGARTIQNDGDVNVAGQIGYFGNLADAFALTKTGAGTLTLAANNPFNGVLNINGGRVNVNGTLNAINAAGNGVIVGTGGTLGGTGAVLRDVSVVAGGSLNPGVTAGTLSTFNTTFAAGSTFRADLNSVVAGFGYDQLNVSGSLNLGGATLATNFGFTPNVGDSFTLINNDGTDAVVGTFAALPQNGTFVTPQGTYRISYTGGDGNDVSIVRLDTTPPTLIVLDRGVPGSILTNASSVTFRAVFNEAVTGLTAANFTFTGAAAAAGVFGTISTSDGGTTWAIPVTGLGTASGTFGIDLTSAAGVNDLAGNALATTSLVGGQYVLDHVRPTATIVLAPGQGNPTGTIPIKFNVTFSEPVGGLTAAGIGISGTAGASNLTITGGGQDFVVSVARVNANGTVILKVNANASQDAAGNGNIASGNASITYNLAATYALAAGPGNGPDVRVYDGNTGLLRYNFFAYSPAFRGGVSVAVGDINGDNVGDIVTAAGPGGAPHIRAFDGKTGVQLPGYSFLAYAANYTGGVNVAAGDVNGDGVADIITATKGTAPHVKVFDGNNLAEIASFFAYVPSFAGGVNVAAGDIDGDGNADVITGVASQGPSHVRVFRGGDFAEIRSFFAFAVGYTGGVNVSAGRIDADTNEEIVVSANVGNGHVLVFDGATNALTRQFFAFDASVQTGVRVAAVDSQDTGFDDVIVTVTGPSQNPRLRRFFSDTGTLKDEIRIYEPLPLFAGGIFVG